MLVNKLQLGEEDARNLKLRSPDQKQAFIRAFIEPAGFDLDEFIEGDRYFVTGAKGSGKTALLQFIRLIVERDLGATTGFYYFQSSFREVELDQFKQAIEVGLRVGDELVDDPKFQNHDEIPIFWRLFLLVQVAGLLRRAGVGEGPVASFYKAVEALKLIARAERMGAKYPALKSFHAKLSRDPSIEISGDFQNATPDDLQSYFKVAEGFLDEVYMAGSPIFLFVDELEVYFSDDYGIDRSLAAIASMVQAIRDFNERFERSDIRVIAAVRSEVATEVERVQNEVHRILSGRGIQVGWNLPVKSGFHPLEQMILRHIAAQDSEICQSDEITDSDLQAVFRKYMPQGGALRKALNMTWYRPRDMALLFELAKKKDSGMSSFRHDTLTSSVKQELGERMVIDAKSGLGVKYKPSELRAMDRVLRGGRKIYTRYEMFSRIEDLSHQYDDVAILSEQRWSDLLHDMYRAGLIYTQSGKSAHKNFHFRGDPMASLDNRIRIGVHQTLLGEFSIDH